MHRSTLLPCPSAPPLSAGLPAAPVSPCGSSASCRGGRRRTQPRAPETRAAAAAAAAPPGWGGALLRCRWPRSRGSWQRRRVWAPVSSRGRPGASWSEARLGLRAAPPARRHEWRRDAADAAHDNVLGRQAVGRPERTPAVEQSPASVPCRASPRLECCHGRCKTPTRAEMRRLLSCAHRRAAMSARCCFCLRGSPKTTEQRCELQGGTRWRLSANCAALLAQHRPCTRELVAKRLPTPNSRGVCSHPPAAASSHGGEAWGQPGVDRRFDARPRQPSIAATSPSSPPCRYLQTLHRACCTQGPRRRRGRTLGW